MTEKGFGYKARLIAEKKDRLGRHAEKERKLENFLWGAILILDSRAAGHASTQKKRGGVPAEITFPHARGSRGRDPSFSSMSSVAIKTNSS